MEIESPDPTLGIQRGHGNPEPAEGSGFPQAHEGYLARLGSLAYLLVPGSSSLLPFWCSVSCHTFEAQESRSQGRPILTLVSIPCPGGSLTQSLRRPGAPGLAPAGL